MSRVGWRIGLLAVLPWLSLPAAGQTSSDLADAKTAIQAKDYERAIKLLRPLADKGNAAAEKELGALYYRGLGTDADPQRALKLFLAAAANGDPDAEKDVGVVYQNGGPGVGNDVEAVRWFRAAAEQGNSEAQSNLGFMYFAGHGVARDLKESIRWTVRAAEQGHAIALGNIGNDFAKGTGVPQNNEQALFWIDASLQRLPSDSTSRPGHQKFADELAAHLSANDVQRIAAAARAWAPGKGSLDIVLTAAGLPTNGTGAKPGTAAAAPAGPSSGSGLIIDHAGDVLTNNHVVDRCSSIRVRVANGEPVKGTVLAADRAGDLAIVRPSGLLGEPVILRDKPARQGEQVMVAGFPLSGILTSDMSVSEGIVSALAGIGDNTHLIQISAPIQSGNSGGPVFDADGAVIAVVQSAINSTALGMAGTISQNANFAIKASSVREFLDAKAISYETGGGKLHGNLPDRARRSTVFIECQR